MAGVYTDDEEKKARERGLDDWGNYNCLRLMVSRLESDKIHLQSKINKLEDENSALRAKLLSK